MDPRLKSVLDNRLHAWLERRRFLQGAAGLATVSTFATSGSALAQGSLGGDLNFLGWDGEHCGNLAKDFLAKNNIVMQASFQSARTKQ